MQQIMKNILILYTVMRNAKKRAGNHKNKF